MKVVILGAGPSGLSAGYMLASKGVEVTVIDRLSFVGGASASQPAGAKGARMDFGPHVFHLKNPEVNRFFFEHAGDDCYRKVRNERILIQGRLFRYPLEITEVLRYLTPGHVLWMGSAFVAARLRRRLFPMPEDTFESWGVSRFGRPLYEFTCGRYTEKVWGIRPTLLSARLASQKLTDLRLRDILAKLFGGRGEEHKKYWEEYAYPKKGIGTVFENMAAGIKTYNGRILLSAPLLRLSTTSKRVCSITVLHENREEEIPCDLLISTIPLSHLATAFEKGNADLRIDAAKKLSYRGLVLINVEFDCERVTPYDWVYLLDSIYRCNRFTEQKNIGSDTIPRNKTVLCFELAASPGEVFWDASDELLFNLVLEDIRKINFIQESSILGYSVFRLEDAYPMYTLDFQDILGNVIELLSGSENLLTTGRQGLFLNIDIHDSMEMGMRAADNILGGIDLARWYRYVEDSINGRIGSH